MRNDALVILSAIESHDSIIEALQDKAANVYKEKLTPEKFVADIKNEMKTADCLHCGKQPYCKLFIAIVYYKQGNFTEAKKFTEDAILGFRIHAIQWNEAIAYWLMGILLLDENNRLMAKRMLEHAREILTHKILESQREGDFKKKEEIGKICILHIEAAIQEASIPYVETDPNIEQANVELEEPYFPEFEGYLVLPWVPVYERVEAGIKGPILTETRNPDFSEISLVTLENKWHSIHSLRFGDKRIKLTQDREYGWAKVHGHSMNRTRPVQIENGDYVLFYLSPRPNQSEIVIAAQPDSHGDNQYSYMVKRYWHDSDELISETSLSGPEYDPLPMNKQNKILGIVIAVAKPYSGDLQSDDMLSNGASPFPPINNFDPMPVSKEEVAIYHKFLLMVTGDNAVAKRLIQFEKRYFPRAPLKELIERAMTRLELDRARN